MELTIFKRKKGDSKKLLRQGGIPGVLYSKGKESENIYIEKDKFAAILRATKTGRLSTLVFELKDGKKKIKAILKDIQYHLTSYDIIHVDFQILDDKTPVKVKIPIECINVADCVGVKLGGVLRQVIRHLKVRCLPKDMPEEFVLDVKDLSMADDKRLKDIEIPKNVYPLGQMDEVAVVIAKR